MALGTTTISIAAKTIKAMGTDKDGKFNIAKVVIIVSTIILLPVLLIVGVIVFALSFVGVYADLVLPENITYHSVFPQDVIYEKIGDWAMPCDSTNITSEYGIRDNPLNTGTTEKHTGIDFAATWHSPVIAIDGGTVIYAGYKPHYGRCVIIEYEDFTAYYGHLAKSYAIRGSAVYEGMVIGTVGGDRKKDTLAGDSTGPHLHFELRIDGKSVNPFPYLFEKHGLNNDNVDPAKTIDTEKGGTKPNENN